MYGQRLASHIPWYPDADEDENYNDKIMSKKEYQIHANPPPGVKSRHPIYFNHQRLSQIHMASHGPNREIILFKDPGVGKTCDAVGIAETRHEWLTQIFTGEDAIVKDKLKRGKAVIVSQNTTTLNSTFKSDIMNKCTAGTYITKELKRNAYTLQSRRLGSETSSIQKNYELSTHSAFANHIETLTNEQIAQTYSFRVIIIDEVQNYRSGVTKLGDQEVYKKKMTGPLHRFMDNVYGCVIVIISATPTIDNIDEFPSIINLILPKELHIDPMEFKRISENDDLQWIRTEMLRLLVPRLKGRVSRMKISEEVRKTVPRSNMNLIPHKLMKYSTKELWLSVIDNNNDEFAEYSYILKAYRDALQYASKVVHKHEIYASTMVWPGGLVEESETRKIDAYINQSEGRWAFSGLFMQDFNMRFVQCRNYYIRRLQGEIALLMNQQKEAPNSATAEKIDNFQAYMEMQQRRMEKNQKLGIVFNRAKTADLQMMIYTIKLCYSPVIANMIQQIIGIEVRNVEKNTFDYYVDKRTNEFIQDNQECVYIYNEYIARGIAPICLFLEMFGYEPLPQGENFIDKNGAITRLTEAKRYALMYSSDKLEDNPTIMKKSDAKMSGTRIAEILRVANHPDNKYGRYLKVVAGTSITAQGINFLNVRQIHMTSRGWNEGQNIQTEGRVDRPAGSHEAFDDSDMNAMNKIYDNVEGGLRAPYNVIQRNGVPTQKYIKLFRHVAYYPSIVKTTGEKAGENASIGLQMYDDAAFKYLKNTIPLDILEDIAYDNRLNILPKDRKRPPLASVPGAVIPVDFTTYNMFYARKELESIKCHVRGLFKVFFNMSLIDILKKLPPDYDQTTVIKALTEMVNDNERIIDRHGEINYIRERNDIFFLQKLPSGLRTRGDQWMSYYSMHNYIVDPLSIEMAHSMIIERESEQTLDRMVATNDADLFVAMLREQTNLVKSHLVEFVIRRYASRIKEGKMSGPIADLIFQTLHPNLIYLPESNFIIHIYDVLAIGDLKSGGKSSKNTITEGRRQNIRVFSLVDQRWRNFTKAEAERYSDYINTYIARYTASAVSNLTHWGHIVITNGYPVLKLQFRMNIDRSSSITKKTKSVSQKAAHEGGGQVAGTIEQNLLLNYLWSVDVDVFVLVTSWPTINHPQVGTVTPILLQRLQRDPKGQYNYGPVNLRIHYASINHFVCNVPEATLGDLISKVPPTRKGVLHYNKVYPEILGWILEDKITEIPKTILTKSNALFFPYVLSPVDSKGAVLVNVQNPSLPNVLPGNRYETVIDLLPNEERRGKYTMLSEIVGSGDYIPGSNNHIVGGVMTDNGGKRELHLGGSIIKSLNMMAVLLARPTTWANNPGGLQIFSANLDELQTVMVSENKPFNVEFGIRFGPSWQMTRPQLAILIFILFKLKGAIIE